MGSILPLEIENEAFAASNTVRMRTPLTVKTTRSSAMTVPITYENRCESILDSAWTMA